MKQSMQLQRFLILLALPLLISLSACIAVPVKGGHEVAFKNEKLAFIEIGKSTKAEIDTAMSDFPMETDRGRVRVKLTPLEFRDGDWWLYAQIREELKWGWIIAFPEEVDFSTIGDVDYRFLLIKFDNNGIVSGYELSSSEGSGCNPFGVCVRESRYMLLASDDEDRVVKQFDIPADRCGVYLYGGPTVAIPILLDGYKVGWLMDKKKFFFWQLRPDVHELAPNDPYAPENRPIEFSCAAGHLYFFELERKSKGLFGGIILTEIEQRDAVTGRKAIGKRQLMLSIL